MAYSSKQLRVPATLGARHGVAWVMYGLPSRCLSNQYQTPHLLSKGTSPIDTSFCGTSARWREWCGSCRSGNFDIRGPPERTGDQTNPSSRWGASFATPLRIAVVARSRAAVAVSGISNLGSTCFREDLKASVCSGLSSQWSLQTFG